MGITTRGYIFMYVYVCMYVHICIHIHLYLCVSINLIHIIGYLGNSLMTNTSEW